MMLSSILSFVGDFVTVIIIFNFRESYDKGGGVKILRGGALKKLLR